jgi:hypothetical protein
LWWFVAVFKFFQKPKASQKKNTAEYQKRNFIHDQQQNKHKTKEKVLRFCVVAEPI